MGYDITWIIPKLRSTATFWNYASTLTVTAVGLFSKIIIGQIIFIILFQFFIPSLPFFFIQIIKCSLYEITRTQSLASSLFLCSLSLTQSIKILSLLSDHFNLSYLFSIYLLLLKTPIF